MDAPHHLPLLVDIGYSIVFAAVAAHAARLVRQPLLLGYVLGGVLLGQSLGFGLVTDGASIELISEIGLIFLLFIIGLEINLRDVASMGKPMFGLGAAQFMICAGLGLPVFWWLSRAQGWGGFSPLYLAVTFALSSTLIVVKLLHDKAEIHTMAGRLTVGVLVVQDLWAILFMAVQPNLAAPQVGQVLRSLFYGAALVGAAFLASRYLLGRIFHAAEKRPELVLLTSTAWCFAVCALAEKAGLSKEMGALVAGMALAAFPYAADVTAKLAGVRDFFVTLFFVSLGLKVQRPDGDSLALALLLSAFVLATRLLSVAPVAVALGQGWRNGIVAALNLSQISEFSLVILALGAGYGHLPPEVPGLVLLAMLVTSVLSTYLIQFNDHAARRLVKLLGGLGVREKTGNVEAAAAKAAPRDIVLLGCFQVGPAFLDAVDRAAPHLKERILVVDYNVTLPKRLVSRGFHWVYGDIAHPETLQHLGIEGASHVICGVPDAFLKGMTNARLLGHLKKLAPQARLILMAEDEEQAARLKADGAFEVLVTGKLSGEKVFSILTEAS